MSATAAQTETRIARAARSADRNVRRRYRPEGRAQAADAGRPVRGEDPSIRGGDSSAPTVSRGAPRTGSERRRWIALAVLCLGQLMMVLDATIVNVALPSIQRDLHFTQQNVTWGLNAYLITFGGFR